MGDLFDGLIFDPAIFDTLPNIEPGGTTPIYSTRTSGSGNRGFAVTRSEIPIDKSTVELTNLYLQAKLEFAKTGNLVQYNLALKQLLGA